MVGYLMSSTEPIIRFGEIFLKIRKSSIESSVTENLPEQFLWIYVWPKLPILGIEASAASSVASSGLLLKGWAPGIILLSFCVVT